MTHKHKAIESKSKDRCWTYCVAQGPCSGQAHGCIVRIDTCACGATRSTEINQSWRKYGPWNELAAEVQP